MVDGNVLAGRLGERIAADYLELSGYAVVERNFRAGNLEIDIVAREGRCIVFVEVKLRRTSNFGEAIEAVGSQKLLRLKEAARRYITASKSDENAEEYRFDLVAIDLHAGGEGMVLRHVQGI